MAPQPPSKVIKYLLILETIATIYWCAWAFFKPDALLAFLGASPEVHSRTSLAMAQMVAALTAGFTIISGLAAAEGPAAATLRKVTYIFIGGGEVILCIALFFMMSDDRRLDVGGVTNEGLRAMIMQLGIPAVFRAFALIAKPHWFGANTVRGKTV